MIDSFMKSLVPLFLSAFLLIAGLLPAQALTEAEQKTVLRAQDWLQSVETLTARFVQVGGGGQAVGTMLLKRPGLIRFNYSPPAKVLLVSDGVFVSFIDYEVGQVSQWPLSQTPLSYLVPEQLDLMGQADVDQVRRAGGQVSFRLRDPEDPEQGTITLRVCKAEVDNHTKSAEGGLLHFSVTDTGIGMTPTVTNVGSHLRNIKFVVASE